MLKKSLYRLLILSANLFLLLLAFGNRASVFAEDDEKEELTPGISLDQSKIHGVQDMYFMPKDSPAHQSQFHDRFEPLHDVDFRSP